MDKKLSQPVTMFVALITGLVVTVLLQKGEVEWRGILIFVASFLLMWSLFTWVMPRLFRR